jgi:hypothetical protein
MIRIIPSANRADICTTHKLIKDSLYLVPESQLDDYKKYVPNVISHSDNIKGISSKRNFIIKKYNQVIMFDDDLQAVCKKSNNKKTKDINEIDDIINNLVFIAKELDAQLFGFSNITNPITYSGLKYFSSNKLINGFIGINNTKNNLSVIDDIYKEDYYLCLLNAYYNRYSIIDERYSFEWLKSTNLKGGCSIVSNRHQKEKESTEILLKYFRNNINKKNKNNSVRKQKNDYEISLNIPI